MVKEHNDEIRREVVRIALTSGQPRRQVRGEQACGV